MLGFRLCQVFNIIEHQILRFASIGAAGYFEISLGACVRIGPPSQGPARRLHPLGAGWSARWFLSGSDGRVPRRIKVAGVLGAGLARGYDAERGRVKASRKWYNSKAWRDRRAMQLALEPVCALHSKQGLVLLATVADHVEPHREDAARFWHGRLQSLCASCHSREKQRQERGTGGGGSASTAVRSDTGG
jgi:5-methylcytosine-specific restriction enzyme A